MSLLTVNNLSHSFGEKELYADASFALHKGEHMGVVGQNGTGKSTLIRILLGEIVPAGGQIQWQPGARIGHIDQYAQIEGALSIGDYLRTAFAPLYEAEKALQLLYAQMARQADERCLKQAARWQQQLEDGDFYAIDNRVARVATGLGLAAIGMDRPLSTLSGGQRTKCILAKLLLMQPDVLLLDEPTNFLDAEHIDWLSEYLAAFAGSFLIVSHDFQFLDKVTDCIADIEFQTIKKYHGRYFDFVRQKEQRRADYESRYQAQRRETDRLEAYIAKNKARASTARMAQSRQKKLDKMEKIAPPSVLAKPAISFKAHAVIAQRALTVQQLQVGYSAPLLPPISFNVEDGQKIAIHGFNGIGKTTLMRTLMGELPALGGGFAFAPAAKIGYFQQDFAWEHPQLTPLQWLGNNHPDLHPRQLRRELARCGVSARHAMQPLSSLSGGERNKVKLCALTMLPHNLLLLDEPTNHLDAETKEALREAIRAFPGAVLLVSHERAFYAQWIDGVMDIEGLLAAPENEKSGRGSARRS